MIIYEKYEEQRAELFKNLGYFFISLTGLSIIQMVVFGQNIKQYWSIQGIAIIAAFIASFICLSKSSQILEKLDLDKYKYYYNKEKGGKL